MRGVYRIIGFTLKDSTKVVMRNFLSWGLYQKHGDGHAICTNSIAFQEYWVYEGPRAVDPRVSGKLHNRACLMMNREKYAIDIGQLG